MKPSFFSPHLVDKMLQPLGVFAMIALTAAHGASWTWLCDWCLAPNEEIRDIVRPAFKEVHHVNSDNISLLTGQYRVGLPKSVISSFTVFQNASNFVVYKSWFGILSLTLFSCYCMSVYLVLGYKIMKKMNQNTNMSTISATLNRQLFKALVAQTCIPMFASFLPTVIAWYAPMFLINVTWLVIHFNAFIKQTA